MSNKPRTRSAKNKKTVPFSTEKVAAKAAENKENPKPGSLKKTLYLVLAIVSLVIGIHRVYIDAKNASISAAIGYNYWIFMITISALLLLRYERKKTRT